MLPEVEDRPIASLGTRFGKSVKLLPGIFLDEDWTPEHSYQKTLGQIPALITLSLTLELLLFQVGFEIQISILSRDWWCGKGEPVLNLVRLGTNGYVTGWALATPFYPEVAKKSKVPSLSWEPRPSVTPPSGRCVHSNPVLLCPAFTCLQFFFYPTAGIEKEILEGWNLRQKKMCTKCVYVSNVCRCFQILVLDLGPNSNVTFL